MGTRLGWITERAPEASGVKHSMVCYVGDSSVPPVYRLSHTDERARHLVVNY